MRRRRAPCALLTAAAVGAAVAGCANGRVSSQDDVRATVRTFLDQCAADRPVRALELLDDAARRVLIDAGGAQRGCAAVLRVAPADAAPAALRAATIHLDRFDGAQATVGLRVGGAAPVAELSFGAGGWRIEGPS